MKTTGLHRTLRLFLLTLLLAGLVVPASAQVFVASLSGASEVPANASAGNGRIQGVLTGMQLVVTGAFSGLESNYSASHIHEAPVGVNGGVIVALTPTIGGDMRSGTYAAADNTFDLTADQVSALMTGEFYVNVHSADLPGGEIRGQFGQSVLINEVDADQTDTDAAEFVELYNPTASAIDLSPMVLVFFNGSNDASYEAFDLDGFTIDPDGYFVLCGNAANTPNCDLDVSPETNLVQNGADAVALFMGEAASFLEGTPVTMAGLLDALVYDTDDGDDAGLLAGLGQMTQYNENENGMGTTQSNQRSPSGGAAIVAAEPTPGSGLVVPTGPVVSFTEGSASVAEGMMATLTVQLDFPDDMPDGNPVTVSVDFDTMGSTADMADFTGPTPGTVMFSGNTDGEMLAVTVDLTAMDGVEGSETAAFTLAVTSGVADVGSPGTFALTIQDTDLPPTVTMAEARALGSGSAVTVEGVVTRTEGAFTYLQDDTGGLTIRQTSGTFFDAVAAGTIVPGSELQVSGTLSEFNGLLQINDGDLQSWTSLGTTDVPAPQLIDLAELAANGEAYEAELVQVTDLTIETADATFSAATNYGIDDPSDDGDAVVMRVPNAGDSELDGEAIPPSPVVFTGVVGQFDSSDPRDSGYQLMAIQLGDVVELVITNIADARAAGVGATVTVEGVVSRAMGAFTYLQDDTGGLTIRQTSGAFFDAVAAGTIATGTMLRVTGTLSEFNGLLQVNTVDLDSWINQGTTDAPTPQTVNLAELAANGEAYEAELVQVEGVTIDILDPFTAATTYDVEDGSDDGDAVSLRVPNADDTAWDGLSAPERVTFMGVIGQFDSSDPRDSGYQLMLIQVEDLLDTTPTEPGGQPLEFALHRAYPNPVTGTATLRYALDEAGVVRLAVYDLLGREIAVLVDAEQAAQEYRIPLDVQDLASGVYVVRLTAGDRVQTQRITVLK